MATNDEKLITLSNLEQFKQDLDPYLVHNLFTLTTVAGNANSGNYLSVRWYVSGVDGITEPYDGMKIAIKIPLAGVGTAGAMLSINGNNANDYHPLAYNNNSVLTTHFAVNSIKIFTYVANQSMTCYKTKNTSSSVNGIWKAEGDYDSNTTITYGTIAYYFRPYAAESIYRYKLVMLDKDNRLVPLVTNEFPVQILVNNVATHTTIYSDWASSTNYAKDVVVHRVVSGASKWYKSLQASNKNHTPESSATWWTEITQNSTSTTHAFRPDKIYWYNTTTTIASGAAVGGNTLMSNGYNQPSLAYYNFNDGLLAYRVFYLCGIYDKNTGLFTLRDAGVAGSKNYYTILPTNSSNITLSDYFTNGYDYILVGGTYSSNNYVHLREDHPMYHFDGTNLVPYDTWNITNSIPDTSNFIEKSQTAGLVKNDGTIDTTQYTTNTGTVTSVDMSVPTGFTVSGNPITTNGTFNVALASGYELLNSNSEQTIVGEKLFTSPITLYNSSNGDTPLLIFRRGTLTDNYNDWAIVDSAGLLYLKQRGSGSTSWNDNRVIFAQAYTDIKGEIKENGTSLASKYVRVDTNVQGLSDTQKANAKTNMGIIDVVANPTLAGTESFLTSLQIGNTKYKLLDTYEGEAAGSFSIYGVGLE